MYLRHFALTPMPFETPAHTYELFESNARREAEARLHHLIELKGIGLITGEVGSSRTSIGRIRAWAVPSWTNRSPSSMYRSSQPRRCAASIIASVVSFFTMMEPTGSITTPTLMLISTPLCGPTGRCRGRDDRSERVARKGSRADTASVCARIEPRHSIEPGTRDRTPVRGERLEREPQWRT